MFDIGWSEMLVVAVVAIIVVGPKDLPRMLRTVGRTLGQLRRTANDFRRQFDDALREAEREADLDDTRKSLESIGKIDPLAEVRDEVKSIKSLADKPLAGEPDTSGTAAAPDAGTGAATTDESKSDAKTDAGAEAKAGAGAETTIRHR